MCLLAMVEKLYFKFHYSYNSTLKSSAQKQLIDILYKEMKSLDSIFSWCKWSEDCSFKERLTSIISWR